MTFKDLCNILYPSLKARCKNKAELFDTLIINSISPKNEIIRTEISKISYKQKSNLVNGTSSFENVAKKIYPAMDFSDLSKIIESEIKGENLDDLIETLNLHNMKVNKDNLSLNIVNELRQIILNNTSNFRRSQIEGTATLRAKLYEEDDGLCPNCGKALSLDSTKENAIVAIALDNFSPDDAQKTIGLCRKCAEKFRNGDIEKDLVEIKTKLENKAQLRKLDGFINLEEQIKNAI